MDKEHQTKPRSSVQLARGAFVGIVFGVLGLYAVMRLTDSHISWTELAQIEPITLIMACGLMLLVRLIDSLRMSLLTRSLGGNLSVLSGIRISILGAFVSNTTPFSSGGGPMQVYLLTESGLSPGQSTAVLATRTLCNTFARFTLGLVVSVWLFCFAEPLMLPKVMHVILRMGVIIYFTGLGLSIFFILNPEMVKVLIVPVVSNRVTLRLFEAEKLNALLDWMERELTEFRKALSAFLGKGRSTLMTIILLSYGWWIALTAIPVVALAALGIQPKVFQVMAITMMFYLAASYAPTPGASGGAELGFGLLFRNVVPGNLLGPFVTLWRGFTYYLNLVSGALLIVVSVLQKGSQKIHLS
jgi:uncharacterized protein (TIRG00374 family)